MGQIPLAQAKKVLAEHYQEIVTGKYLAEEKPRITFNEAADSFLAFSEARKKSHRRDLVSVKTLRAFFGARALESLTPNLVEDYLAFRKKKAEEKGRSLMEFHPEPGNGLPENHRPKGR